MSESRCRAVLFDLDGTLADTAPDLAGALNALLTELGESRLPFADIRPHVSHGARAMIGFALNLQPDDEGYAPLHRRFLEIYSAGLAEQTVLFDGMEELLLQQTGPVDRSVDGGTRTDRACRLHRQWRHHGTRQATSGTVAARQSVDRRTA